MSSINPSQQSQPQHLQQTHQQPAQPSAQEQRIQLLNQHLRAIFMLQTQAMLRGLDPETARQTLNAMTNHINQTVSQERNSEL